jgi:hypothetical protein
VTMRQCSPTPSGECRRYRCRLVRQFLAHPRSRSARSSAASAIRYPEVTESGDPSVGQGRHSPCQAMTQILAPSGTTK